MAASFAGVTFKSSLLFVLFGALFGTQFSCIALADYSDIRISRERSVAEVSDPAAFAAYQQRMKLRRVARSSRLQRYYLDQNDGSDAVDRSVLRRQGSDGKWYGWRWFRPYIGRDGTLISGHYEAAN